MLSLLRQTLQSGLTLRTGFARWNEIARALREPPRRRKLQPDAWQEPVSMLS
jgi:hypothetical protein